MSDKPLYTLATGTIVVLFSVLCAFIAILAHTNTSKGHLEKRKVSAFASCIESAIQDSLHIITPAVIQVCQNATHASTAVKH